MPITRRTTLALGAAAAASAVFKPYVARAAAPFEQPPLPYAEDALAPQISARTVGLHYGKHHKGYFDKLNELAPGTPYADMELEEVVKATAKDGQDKIFNQAAQAWNHVFYWDQFDGGPAAPEGAFAEAVVRDFGDEKGLFDAFGKEGGNVFGTGWVWLVSEGGKLAVLGSGDQGLEGALLAAASRHRGRIGIVIGYNEPLSHLMQAGADAILIPSRFEPCGLTQLYGLRYGCIPVVARTGGLADTVIDANEAALAARVATGFQFTPITTEGLRQALRRVFKAYREPKVWARLQNQGMKSDVSWERSAERYADLYSSLLARR